MNKKNLFFIILIIACIAFFSTQCRKNNTEETSIATTKAEEEILKSSSNFINNIEKENYKNIKEDIYLPDNCFVTNEDIIWFLPRTNISDLIGKRTDVAPLKFENANIDSNISEVDTVAKTITYQSLESKDKAYEMTYILNDKNEYKLYLNNFLIRTFSFVADKNLDINVNGTNIDASYITKEYTGSDAPSENSVVYTIPNVPNKEIPITITQGKNSKVVRVNTGNQNLVILQ